MKPLYLILPEAREMAKETGSQVLEGKRSSPFEYRAINKAGEARWVLAYITTVQYRGKLATLGSRVDITERKQAEEALQQSEEKYRLLVSNIPEIVWTIDSKGNVIFVSPDAETITGYPLESLYKEGFRIWSAHTHPDDLPGAREAIKSLFERQIPLDLECRVKRKDSQWIWVHHRAAGTYQKDGIQYADGVSSDITERKKAEEILVQSVAALARTAELRRSRQRLVTAEESIRRDIAQQLHGSVQNRLIVLLLRLTELERTLQKEGPSAELTDICQKLEELLENHVRPISHRLYPSILRRGLVPALQSLGDQFETVTTVEMKFDETLIQRERDDRQFIPEPVRLAAYRIAEEALTNVAKHAKASGVTIELDLPAEGQLRLTVRDNGRGFDLASTSGSLGMLMMHDYAEIVSGDCVIRSAPGEGTEITATFTFAGPVAEPQEKASS